MKTFMTVLISEFLFLEEILLIVVFQLLFSKCLSGCWPHYGALAQRCVQVSEAIDKGEDIECFTTKGVTVKQRAKRKPAPVQQPVAPMKNGQKELPPMEVVPMEEPPVPNN